MAKVLISDKLSPKAKEIFEENGIEVDNIVGMSPDELKACIDKYDGLAIRSATKVTKEIIKSAKNLKVIGRAGIGVDNVDIPEATANGIIVMNTPFGNSVTTAEHAIALMISLARKIPQASQSTHEGKWEKSKFMGTELYNKTLGLIGCGNIGSIVANRAQGLKMKVVGFDPFLTPERAKDLNIEKVELDELLARADFISLHTPLNDATRNILNKESIAKTKKGIRIINCARGGLVNEADLKEAITSGHVAGAALDVFEEEPAKENILFGMEEVICTPHLGASTSEAQENVAIDVAKQMSAYLKSGEIQNALNIPSISAEDAAKLKPYIDLASQLGSFAGQLNSDGLKSIEIEYQGAVSKLNVKPITAVALKGILSSALGDNVNMVNAPVIAKERNIDVKTSISDKDVDYKTLIKINIKTEKGKLSLSGTLFGDVKPRIIKVNGVKLEAAIGSNILYINNEDKAGLIGNLGMLLGDNGINIANFHLGRNDQNSEAIALVEVDEKPSSDVIEKVKALNSVLHVKLLQF